MRNWPTGVSDGSALGHLLPRHGLIGASALPPKSAAAVAEQRVRYGPKGGEWPRPLSLSHFTCPLDMGRAAVK